MKALKASVIIMGALIVILLTVVIVTVARRAGQDAPRAGDGAMGTLSAPGRPSVPVAGAPAGSSAGPRGFTDTAVALPPGAEIVETRAGDGRLVLRLRTADGGAALLLVDPATGRRLGLIRLAPGADGAAGR